MASYHGTRGAVHDDCLVIVDRDDGGLESLPPRTDLINHSPTGFEWGYEGSGPAQLALAILAHYSGNDGLARRLHQTFKRDVIAHFPRSGWNLEEHEIADWLNRQTGGG